ncbi:MAG: hypothetical protein HWD61_14005 [Parachlamydiaceae bacterium]|nr:MAG: hypothetical protein HWD61_14005 [Parachlamydiaceae bacterium]
MSETKYHDTTSLTIRSYLKIIADLVLNDGTIPDGRKRDTLINIAQGCEKCLPGRLTKIQEAYKKLVRPRKKSENDEADNDNKEEVKAILLHHVELFKNTLLTEQLKDVSESAHAFSAALADWGNEFGLDSEVGMRDQNIHVGRSELHGWSSQFVKEDGTAIQCGPKTYFELTCRKTLWMECMI